MVETDSTKKIVQMLDGYDRGIYTFLEASSQILECITAQDIADVYLTLPERFKQHLNSVVESAPNTDEEWHTAEYVHIGSACYAPGYEPPVESEEERHAKMQEWKMNHRLRIEAIRQFLDQVQ